MIVGAFGNTVFEVSNFKVLTFDGYKRTTKHKFTEHEIITQKPITESLGNELEEISFTMTFVAALGVNPRRETEKLRELCRNGSAEYLVIGTEVIGDCRFVIEEISEAVETWGGYGNIIVSKVDVKLKEYRTDGVKGGVSSSNLGRYIIWG